MPNPLKNVLGRLAKWLVRKGKEELEKEIETQRQKPESHRPTTHYDFQRRDD